MALLCSGAIGLAACGSDADHAAVPSTSASAGKVESGTLTLGTQPWIGYGPFTLAAKDGLFAKQGLTVKTVNFTEDKQINAAVASGRVDAVNAGTIQALSLAAAGLPVKIVMLEDVSSEDDAILAKDDIASVADLKGKKVAYEEGTTGEVLLRYALQQSGLTIDDIKKVPLPATQAGSAIIAGRVDAAYTYEPFISAALKGGRGIKKLYTAAARPGIISDALVVRDDLIKDKPGQVAALIRSWQAGLDSYNADKAAGQAVIAQDLGSPLGPLKDAFDGLTFYDLAQNRKDAANGRLSATVKVVADIAEASGLLKGKVDLASLIDTRFLGSAAK